MSSSHPSNPTFRERDRHAFAFCQRFAPLLDGVPPRREDFRSVPFRDVSSTGIAFLVENYPGFDRVVVELGVQGNVSYREAKVVHVTQVEQAGQVRFLVGCELVGHVEPR